MLNISISRSLLVLAVSAFVLLAGGSKQSHALELLKVRAGMVTVASQMALDIGQKKGFFAKHGFDVDIKPLTTGVQANQALAANQVDWSAGGVEFDNHRKQHAPALQALQHVCEGRRLSRHPCAQGFSGSRRWATWKISALQSPPAPRRLKASVRYSNRSVCRMMR